MAESKPRKRKAAKKKTKKKSPRRKKPQEPARQFSRKQYDMLLRCSDKEDIAEWNKWRDQNRGEKILLERANLQGAKLLGANLQGVHLPFANLQGAVLTVANLQGANLFGANLEGANLRRANLQGAQLRAANLRGAHLREANLQGGDLGHANLQGADLRRANLQGAKLSGSDLNGADFYMAAVDGQTIILTREIDKKTDFRGVGLDSARVDPGLKQLLKYNIRRIRWREWYEKGTPWVQRLKKAFIQPFWWMSDYGRSTGRIAACFFVLAALFAIAYLASPSMLMVNGKVGDVRGPLHALYFSVVTMTTLGFGDIHANPDSRVGQILLMFQVLLGYILLAALVTRFAVLFQAGGPAGKFPDEKTTWEGIKDTLLAVRRKLLAVNQRLVRDWQALCRRVKPRHGSDKGDQEDQQGDTL